MKRTPQTEWPNQDGRSQGVRLLTPQAFSPSQTKKEFVQSGSLTQIKSQTATLIFWSLHQGLIEQKGGSGMINADPNLIFFKFLT